MPSQWVPFPMKPELQTHVWDPAGKFLQVAFSWHPCNVVFLHSSISKLISSIKACYIDATI